jgi:hypothetical protein
MYSLYVEQTGADLRFLCETDDESRAAGYATHWSKILARSIVIVRQFDDGATTVVGTYKEGRPDPEMDLPSPAAAGGGHSSLAPVLGG